MIRFDSDYTEGAHPRILEALKRTNFEQTNGYGDDVHCRRAAGLIRRECGTPDAQVHFLVGGTQTNLTVISSILRPYQGVLCACGGHIACHETGAVEAAGHKVLPLPDAEGDGKITAAQVREAVERHMSDVTREHTVQPGMVYISQSSECGTVYGKRELEEMRETCREFALPLFIDGARLGYALAGSGGELTLREIAENCDVFYVGGTKVGLLFGEAVVITNPALTRDFRYMMKQRGAMLAKGRLLGVQFEEAFSDGLYYEMSAHAVNEAARIKQALTRRGIPLLFDSPTNQLFPILTREQQEALSCKYVFSFWQHVDEQRDAVRICTSWATPGESVDELISDISEL